MTATVLPFQVFEAPEHWRTVDFISDLHLYEKNHATFLRWQRYMQETTADAVFILGDLFEVWVGDDAAAQDPFLQSCVEVLRKTAQRAHVGFMPGNRDPQYSEWIAFSGVSVDSNGKQHYLDVNVAYRQACLNAIEYLKKFGFMVFPTILSASLKPPHGWAVTERWITVNGHLNLGSFRLAQKCNDFNRGRASSF